ncbi:MAG: VWA domain-containing protein [Luteitalea sp.]|nr:VWA domain-containing protein [Luteitalea sp.]
MRDALVARAVPSSRAARGRETLVGLAVLIGVALLPGSLLLAQTPAFKSSVATVPLYVTVTDGDGRLVPGLTQQDFEVYDNDKKQELTLFRSDVTPFTATVMLDTSLSMALLTELLKNATEQFVIRMLPDDLARVGYFNDKIEFTSEFTNDRDALIRSLDHVDFGNPTRLWDAVDFGLDALEPLDERRVIVVFTDGDDTDSRRSRGDVLERTRATGIIVYAIGLDSELVVDGRRIRTSPDRGLRGLAEESGGGFFHLEKRDELGSAFTRVVQELHTQYVLGFTPEVFDDEVHELEVKLKRRGLRARTRRSYVASAQPTKTQ